MSLSLYLENQVHGRTYAGADASRDLSVIVALASSIGLIAQVEIYGDTMFNCVQIDMLLNDFKEIEKRFPECKDEVRSMRQLFEGVIRNRGYIWIEGD